MSDLATALENDYLQQASPQRDATLQSAAEAIGKARAR
jgi:hypothetical protein